MRERLELALESPRTRRAGILAGCIVAGMAVTLLVAVLVSLLFGQKLITIGSDSQAPALHSGDLVLEREVRPDEVEVGEIITFSDPLSGESLSHRVREIEPLENRVRFVTRGDSNDTFERFTLPDDGTVAVVTRRVPFAGHLADAIGGPIVLVFAGVAALVAAVAYLLRRRRLMLPGT